MKRRGSPATRTPSADGPPLPRALLALAFASVLSSPVLSAAPALARPNMVVVLVDDLRWDEVDYPFVRVPHIERIAREGARFTTRS